MGCGCAGNMKLADPCVSQFRGGGFLPDQQRKYLLWACLFGNIWWSIYKGAALAWSIAPFSDRHLHIYILISEYLNVYFFVNQC